MEADVPTVSAPAPGATRILSSQLLRGQRCVVIVHSGQEYRLQVTKAGKLILTK